MKDGWAFDANYTYSSTRDNVFGDGNFNTPSSTPLQLLRPLRGVRAFPHGCASSPEPHRRLRSPFWRRAEALVRAGIASIPPRRLDGQRRHRLAQWISGGDRPEQQQLRPGQSASESHRRQPRVYGLYRGKAWRMYDPRRLVGSGSLHARRCAAHGDPRPHAFLHEHRPCPPEDRAARTSGDGHPARGGDQRLRDRELPGAQHLLRQPELRPVSAGSVGSLEWLR